VEVREAVRHEQDGRGVALAGPFPLLARPVPIPGPAVVVLATTARIRGGVGPVLLVLLDVVDGVDLVVPESDLTEQRFGVGTLVGFGLDRPVRADGVPILLCEDRISAGTQHEKVPDHLC